MRTLFGFHYVRKLIPNVFSGRNSFLERTNGAIHSSVKFIRNITNEKIDKTESQIEITNEKLEVIDLLLVNDTKADILKLSKFARLYGPRTIEELLTERQYLLKEREYLWKEKEHLRNKENVLTKKITELKKGINIF